MSTENLKLYEEVDNLITNAFKEVKNSMQKSNESQDDMKKSFDEIGTAASAGADISLESNGGGDVIKNKDKKDQDMESMKKKKDCKSEDGDEDEDDKSKAKKAKDKKDKEDDDDDDKEDDKKNGKDDMKKSFEVSQEDYEILVKAKKEAQEKEELKKAQANPLYKSVSSLVDVVKGLSAEIVQLKGDIGTLRKSPARDPKALLNQTEVIEKSENSTTSGGKVEGLRKSQVLDVLLDLQKSNTIDGLIVMEYEATNKISNPSVRDIVNGELNKRFGGK